MPYSSKTLKTDLRGQPVPQIFDIVADDFAPLTGQNLGGGRYGTDNMMWGKTSGGLYLPVQVGSAGEVVTSNATSGLSPVTTMQNAATATGVGTQLPTNGYGVAAVAISGTFVATITFEGLAADGNWYTLGAVQRGGGGLVTAATAPGVYQVNCLGLSAVRANITAYTSGSITAKGQAQAIAPASDAVSLTGSNLTVDKAIPIGLNSGVSTPTGLIATNNAGDSNAGSGIAAQGQYVYNGGSWDRVRNNTQGTLLASAARTSAGVSPNQTNYNARGLMITVSVTAVSGTGGLIPKLQSQDAVTGGFWNYSVDPSAITATGTYSYVFYPGASLTLNGTSKINAVYNIPIPRTWILYMYASDSSSYTYSVGYSLIL